VEGYREVISPSVPSPSIPTPTHANSALEELGPFPVVMHIIDDWFEAIHSVAPILHRRRFLRRLSNGDAETDPEFCGLVVSLCAATVTSLRRKCSATYGTITAERCLSVMKRHHLLGNDGAFTLEWCQAKYNIGATISAERDLDDPEGFRYLCEVCQSTSYRLGSQDIIRHPWHQYAKLGQHAAHETSVEEQTNMMTGNDGCEIPYLPCIAKHGFCCSATAQTTLLVNICRGLVSKVSKISL
jgi:hypothetical protein